MPARARRRDPTTYEAEGPLLRGARSRAGRRGGGRGTERVAEARGVFAPFAAPRLLGRGAAVALVAVALGAVALVAVTVARPGPAGRIVVRQRALAAHDLVARRLVEEQAPSAVLGADLRGGVGLAPFSPSPGRTRGAFLTISPRAPVLEQIA